MFTHCFSALYGVLFPRNKEAAFANYRIWESLGFVIAFAYSTFICLEQKVYIMLAILVLAIITYPVVEFYEYRHPTLPDTEGGYLYEKKDEDVTTASKEVIFQTQM